MDKYSKLNLYARIKTRIEDKDINVSLVATSILINMVMAICKLVFGIYIGSLWLILHAVYFVVLGFARYKAMKSYIYVKNIKEPVIKFKVAFDIHNRSGGFIFLIGSTYLALCLRMYLVGDVVLVGGILVYWFMVFAVFKNVFAVYGIIVTRNKNTPVLRVIKVISVVDALLSIVPVLYTSMSYFEMINSAEIPAVAGILISLSVMGGGVVMANRDPDKYLGRFVSSLENKE